MRPCRPSKQRIRLGSGGHPCCGGRGFTYTDTYGNCYSDADRHGNSESHWDRYATAYAYTEVGAISKAAPHTSAAALNLPLYREAQIPAIE